jgi:hypothetical protein
VRQKHTKETTNNIGGSSYRRQEFRFPMKREWFSDDKLLWSRQEITSLQSVMLLFNLDKSDLNSLKKLMRIQNKVWMSNRSRELRINILKQMRKHFIKISMSEPTSFINTDKWDKDLMMFRDSDQNYRFKNMSFQERRSVECDNYCRAIFTILWKSRDLNKEPVIDIDSILNPMELHYSEDKFQWFCEKIIKVVKKTLLRGYVSDENLITYKGFPIKLKWFEFEPYTESVWWNEGQDLHAFRLWRQHKASVNLDLIKHQITIYWKDLGISKDETEWWEGVKMKPRWSSKSGPNGLASLSSFIELQKYSHSNLQNIKGVGSHYMNSWDTYGGLDWILKYRTLPTQSRSINLRRLSAIADYEGKTRIIAIGDWLSQQYLRPLHDKLMKKISSIDGDLTYRHEKISSLVGKYWKERHNIGNPYSIDLTSATDRIPSELTRHILSILWGSEKISNDWFNLMTSWEFSTPSKTVDKTDKRFVKYATGQPMGLYSSWPALSITNHVLVRLSARLCGYCDFSNYFVLGDDVVIYNERIARTYIKITNSIGIGTKDEDSIHPTHDHHLEIAKRLFRKGVEVSPLPIRLMSKTLGLFTLICIDRGLSSRLGALNPGHKENLVSMTAASLLYFWKVSPSWRSSSVHRFKTVMESVVDCAANDVNSHWVEPVKNNTEQLEITSVIFDSWCREESYKIFNSYEEVGAGSNNFSRRKLFRKGWKVLRGKAYRSRLNSKLFRNGLISFVSDEFFRESIENTTVFHYVTNQHSYVSTSSAMSVAELYDNYYDCLTEMRQWVTVSTSQVLANKLETVENRMILGIEKHIKSANLSSDQILNIYLFCIRQSESWVERSNSSESLKDRLHEFTIDESKGWIDSSKRQQ